MGELKVKLPEEDSWDELEGIMSHVKKSSVQLQHGSWDYVTNKYAKRKRKNIACKNFLNKTISGEIKAIISDFSVDSIIIAMERNGVDINEIRGFFEKVN